MIASAITKILTLIRKARAISGNDSRYFCQSRKYALNASPLGD